MFNFEFMQKWNELNNIHHDYYDINPSEEIELTRMCLSINRFSKSSPDDLDTTGSSGTSPDTAATTNSDAYEQLNQNEAIIRCLIRCLLEQFMVQWDLARVLHSTVAAVVKWI